MVTSNHFKTEFTRKAIEVQHYPQKNTNKIDELLPDSTKKIEKWHVSVQLTCKLRFFQK